MAALCATPELSSAESPRAVPKCHSAHPAMANIVPAPTVLRSEVVSIFVGNSQVIPFVGIIVSVVGQGVAGLKLKCAVAAPEAKDNGIIV